MLELPVVTVCWSPKGGSGTTVVVACLALHLARAHGEVVVVDVDGDVPGVLGVADPIGVGVHDWLADPQADAEGLHRLAQPVAPGVALVPVGRRSAAPWPPGRAADLLAALSTWSVPVVVDAGRYEPALHELVAAAPRSLAVMRGCYLSFRRAVSLPVRPSGVVLVKEPGRTLDANDVEGVLDVPVVAEVDLDPAIARAVDAGLLLARVPRNLMRPIRAAA